MSFLDSISREETRSSALLSSAVARLIRDRDLAIGDPLPSEREMSEHLGVSRTLIRTTFANLEKDRLIVREHGRVRRVGSGFDAAGGIPLIAIIGSDRDPEPAAEVQKGWAGHVVYSACRATERLGKAALMVSHRSLRPDRPSLGLPRNTVGVVLASEVVRTCDDLSGLTRAIRGLKLPVVVAGSSPAFDAFDCVASDHAAGASELTRWLLERGRQRILRLWRLPMRPEWLNQRDLGFEAQMGRSNAAVLPPLRTAQLREDRVDSRDFEVVVRTVAGYLVEWRTRNPAGFDALMVATDRHAYEATAACRLLGLEPGKDVLIVGYDDSWEDAPERVLEPQPPAATMNKNNAEIGVRTVRLLDRRLRGVENGAEPIVELLKPQLVVPAATQTRIATGR